MSAGGVTGAGRGEPRSAGAKGSIRIFDTTLRDGEQAPGASLTVAEKLEVARQLVRLNVDVIEAGFPAASPGDFEAVNRIAKETRGVAVAGLARCRDGDPQRAVEALRVAERPHLHVFISTSEIHLQHQIRMTRDEALAEAVRWVRYGREQLGRDAELEFSAMDATRSDPDYLMQVVAAVVEAGATTVNLPDTVGYAIPSEFGPLIRRAVDLVGSDAVISVHCHDDLGLAVANTITAIEAGARQVEVTINGLGERAGNAALEEVVMALATRSAALGGHTTGVVTEQIVPTSRFVGYLTGFVVQPNKAIIGRNAFAHESGIHQDGVLKNPLNFEIMTPQSVGLTSNSLTIGKLSGRRGLQGKLHDLGYDLEGEALDAVYRQAIDLADAKKEVTDADLLALVNQQTSDVPSSVTIVGWSVTSSHEGNATGSATINVGRRRAHGRGRRQRPGQRAVPGRGRGTPAGPRLAPDPDRVRDQGGDRGRGRPGPGPCPLPALVGRRTRRARRHRATGYPPTSSKRRSTPTSWRPTSSTGRRSTGCPSRSRRHAR